MMSPEGESWTSWLCDLEPEDCNFLNESDTNWTGEISFPSEAPAPQEQNLQRSFTTDSNHSHSITTSTFKTEQYCSSTMSNSSSVEDDNTTSERPSKTLKMSNASPSYILAFSNENPAQILNFDSTLKPKSKALTVNVNHHGNRSLESQKKETKRKVQEGEKARSPHQAQDHIIAERKRREKISQQFIALSALIPGLKKMDKASVLGDAIQHVKQLQEQVKLLEEQSQRKSSESVVYVEKSKSSVVDDDVSLSDTSSNSDNSNNFSLPEVEARVLENKVLIRIHCEKQEGVLMNILKEIHNLHLSVINCSTLLFGTSKLDITIIGEMDDGFRLSVKELARKLRVGLLQFM